jgi:hypothetical protein
VLPTAIIPNERSQWVDCLHGKHECFAYQESAVIPVAVGGRVVEVQLPDYLAGVKILVASEADGMLFCFGRTAEKFNNEFCGLVMVAKKQSDTRYAVGVWHELYPGRSRTLDTTERNDEPSR